MLNIATGKSANSKIWKNQQITWEDFAKKLAETVQTKETLKEYLACNKEDQLAIKDTGGYVGGYLRNGRRNINTVVYRQILTLDLDFANIDLWQDFTMWYEYAAVLHSTHKHCEEKPRFRLIIPLDREATREEYEAVGRRLAGNLGIELFDSTTFEPNRLMFWPSTPIDQEYYYEKQTGPFLSVDTFLDQYPDWHDVSLWPTSEKHRTELRANASQQQDPELKKGIIGAFCRTYSITEAIETYLSDEYKATDNGRYTYTKGSTSGGLVLYDDKFAYSHHGTDPTSGKLCNAFDLVRLHKFGNTEASKRQTEELLISDPKIKETLAKERMDSVSYEFAEELETVAIDWMKGLDVDAKGRFLNTALNINKILQNDPNLKEKFRLNDFDRRVYACSSLPWRKIKKPEPKADIDDAGVRNYIETVYGIFGAQKIKDSLDIETEKNHYHPIRDYLDGLKWDGKARIENLLIEYFGAVDNPYTRQAIRKTLIGAVSRIYEPGCKFDLVLVLCGQKEGTGKSTFFDKLGKNWFSDTFSTVHGKEALEQIQGAWIIEIAELAGLKKAEIDTVKHFMSKRVDMFRKAYGHNNESYPRQCIFVATTNSRNVMQTRRFMPVDVCESKATKSSLTKELDGELDQIWAEAVYNYNLGELPFLDAKINEIADQSRADHAETDERFGLIEKYLEKGLPEDWEDKDFYSRRLYVFDDTIEGPIERRYVCAAEIWCECMQKSREDMDRYKTRDINDMMKNMNGWEFVNSTKNFKLYGKQKYYRKL